MTETPWKKIKDAPKDDKPIVYIDDNPSVGVCEWNGEEWWDRDADQICYPVLWVPGPLTETTLETYGSAMAREHGPDLNRER